ncbi:MAG: insulinase family protein [Rhizobiales bacterium]|nr:insulinase family protein [Hyphomicrobiales bacterium]MBI3673504.1 insulinase family protein [Hyphomicrobiales bacterium]
MLRKLLLKVLAFVALSLAAALPSQAFQIEAVMSPGGIKAWLVHDDEIPLIAMNFSFRGGSAFDPAGKEGTVNFITGMMDEGADDLDSAAFQKLRDRLSFKMSFEAGPDDFEGSFQTLSKNREQSFDLLRKVLTKPRFDADPQERVRRQFLLSVRDKDQDPEHIAGAAWMKLALPGDPYSRETDGTEASVAAITAGDLRGAHQRIFNRKTLQVAVVGDIDAKELALLLDRLFGDLPEGSEPPAQSASGFANGPILKTIDRDIPQSIIVFGGPGIRRDDPDFIPAYIMMEILGGSGLSSRLTNEIREKRGLTYGVGANLMALDRLGLVMGSLGTRNEKAAEALAVVKSELDRMAKDGPTAQELADAKTYLTGSYALRFDSNAAIASQLLGIQQQNLGIDYVATRNARVDAVTIDQVRQQARRLLHADALIVTVVGRPTGLTN